MEPDFLAVIVDYDPDLFDLTPAVRDEMERILAEVGARLDVGQYRTEEAVIAAATSAEIVMIQSVRPLLNARVISTLNRCRGIIRMGLGYDSIDVDAATRLAIPVSNIVDWCNDEVAEHAIALLMAGARKVSVLDRGLHAGGWSRAEAVPTFRLRGKTLGLVGFGRVAQAVAQRMAGFGLNLLAFDPYIDARQMAAQGVHKVPLDELLEQADFISVHVRLTTETVHLLGRSQFARMKPGSLLVNTSRGAVLDEPALIEALQKGKPGRAALDVMEREPLPADSPLRQMNNVILTPHLASYSIEAVNELYLKSAQTAASLLSRQWVGTVVNPQVRPAAEARWGAYR